MEDLAKMAIVFIYPDGTVERIPITHYRYHIVYLKNHLKDSKEYAHIARGLDFMEPNHTREDDRFMMSGLVVLYNISVKDIIDNPDFLNNNNPIFLALLPNSMGSLAQINTLASILSTYQKYFVYIRHFNLDKDGYESFEFEETLDYLDKAKGQFSTPRI